MKVLSFLAVFASVTVVATVAFVTAAFMFWSMMAAQPGTATALATLFLVAPAAGVATGLFTAARAVRPRSPDFPEPAGRRWLKVTGAGAIGFLFGYGATRATLDLAYTNFNDPAAMPSWLPALPVAGGIGAAVILALIVFSARSRF